NREELAQRRRWHASPSRWAGSARWAFTRARSRRSSPRRQDPHQEVLGGGAEVPAAEARAQAQAGLLRVGREVLDRVAAVQAEAHHEAPLGGEVRGEAGERGAALRGGEEGQHVPGADGEVELRG